MILELFLVTRTAANSKFDRDSIALNKDYNIGICGEPYEKNLELA
jgi:hypothetical protein